MNMEKIIYKINYRRCYVFYDITSQYKRDSISDTPQIDLILQYKKNDSHREKAPKAKLLKERSMPGQKIPAKI